MLCDQFTHIEQVFIFNTFSPVFCFCSYIIWRNDEEVCFLGLWKDCELCSAVCWHETNNLPRHLFTQNNRTGPIHKQQANQSMSFRTEHATVYWKSRSLSLSNFVKNFTCFWFSWVESVITHLFGSDLYRWQPVSYSTVWWCTCWVRPPRFQKGRAQPLLCTTCTSTSSQCCFVWHAMLTRWANVNRLCVSPL